MVVLSASNRLLSLFGVVFVGKAASAVHLPAMNESVIADTGVGMPDTT